jgi:hypothetical protein
VRTKEKFDLLTEEVIVFLDYKATIDRLLVETVGSWDSGVLKEERIDVRV